MNFLTKLISKPQCVELNTFSRRLLTVASVTAQGFFWITNYTKSFLHTITEKVKTTSLDRAKRWISQLWIQLCIKDEQRPPPRDGKMGGTRT
jgi:hypothetical protein